MTLAKVVKMFTGWELSHMTTRAWPTRRCASRRPAQPACGSLTAAVDRQVNHDHEGIDVINEADGLSPDGQPDEDGGGREAVLNVRLTRREKAMLREVARLAGLTLSELGRRRCLGHRVAIAANPALAEDLRRVSVQVQRLDEESRGRYRARTAAILDTLRGAINRLGAGH